MSLPVQAAAAGPMQAQGRERSRHSGGERSRRGGDAVGLAGGLGQERHLAKDAAGLEPPHGPLGALTRKGTIAEGWVRCARMPSAVGMRARSPASSAPPHLKGAEAVHGASLHDVEFGALVQGRPLPQDVLPRLKPLLLQAVGHRRQLPLRRRRGQRVAGAAGWQT